MEKIIYLFGAGASYGTRECDQNGKNIIGHITRGLPVVNELECAIDYYLAQFSCHISFPGDSHESKFPKLVEELSWLRDKCKEYPTIDTYAKQLSVTGKFEELTRLKNALSAFFSLIQKPNNRDLRYDGFVASLIDNNGRLPNNIAVLSWNYDCQFEYVLNDFSGFDSEVTRVWLNNNFGSKKLVLSQDFERCAFYKVNGTALFSSVNNHRIFVDTQDFDPSYAEKVLSDNNNAWDNNMSFAWEEETNMTETISKMVKDGTVLVVIGYSFPYVNRRIDKLIVNGMPKLKHIYIQDISAIDVQQSLVSIFNSDNLAKMKSHNLKIDCKDSVKQFLIPRELE